MSAFYFLLNSSFFTIDKTYEIFPINILTIYKNELAVLKEIKNELVEVNSSIGIKSITLIQNHSTKA